MNYPPTPPLEELLPVLLNHFPTWHSCSEPPASLYPLLAPILQQRLRLLSGPSTDSWLRLLSWSPSKGSALVDHMSAQDLSPHPSSGEIETGSIKLHGFIRVDEDTLKACGELSDWEIIVVYSWEVPDLDEGTGGWKVIDIHPKTCMDDLTWYSTIPAAEQAFSTGTNNSTQQTILATPVNLEPAEDFTDEADEYWSMYDRSAAQTPAVPPREPPTEESYFERYYGEDSADDMRDEEVSITQFHPTQSTQTSTAASTPPTALSTSSYTYAPRPISSSSNPLKIADLEASVNSRVHGEVAIKQHISTSLKSLYRLARASGIDREEFGSLIQTEVAVLAMMDEDES
ncbi:hypothetical protein EDC01DRAFT_616988 [Geopyxis carbonaria]|nr:hypothetical protein EDC01DRAFT_616988 [Geopyxis carbonaria]